MLCPFAEQRLISTNYSRGRARSIIGVTVHHMDGSWQSAENRFNTPGADASACFGIKFNGDIIQWVDTDNTDYHACQAQWEGWVGIENESDPNQPDSPPTAAQVASIARIANWLGVPAQETTSRSVGGIGYHNQFGGVCAQAWGQTACPGEGFIATVPAIVVAMSGTPTPPPIPTEDEMIVHTQLVDTKNNTHLFVLGENHSVYWKVALQGKEFPKGNETWQNLLGNFNSLPEATLARDTVGNGVITLSGRGSDGAIWYRRYYDDGGGWDGGFVSLGGKVVNPA